jgi:hypothetical protein
MASTNIDQSQSSFFVTVNCRTLVIDGSALTYGISLIFKMAAAGNFENGSTLPVLCFLTLACSF